MPIELDEVAPPAPDEAPQPEPYEMKVARRRALLLRAAGVDARVWWVLG